MACGVESARNNGAHLRHSKHLALRRLRAAANLSPDGTLHTYVHAQDPLAKKSACTCLVCAGEFVGVVQGVSSYQLSKAGMSALLDLRLEQVATRLYKTGLAESLPAIPARGSQPERDIVLTIWKDDMATPYRSTEPSLALPRDAEPGFVTTSVNGENWRIYTLREPSIVIQVAERSRVRHDLAQETSLNTLWPMIVLVPLVWVAVLLVVRRALRRLTRLGAQVQAIDMTHFEQLSTSGVPTEIRPFIVSINKMIERLEQSIEGERKFISDAAHELRTPLTALQLQADNRQPHIAPRQSGALSRAAKRHPPQWPSDCATAAACTRRCCCSGGHADARRRIEGGGRCGCGSLADRDEAQHRHRRGRDGERPCARERS